MKDIHIQGNWTSCTTGVRELYRKQWFSENDQVRNNIQKSEQMSQCCSLSNCNLVLRQMPNSVDIFQKKIHTVFLPVPNTLSTELGHWTMEWTAIRTPLLHNTLSVMYRNCSQNWKLVFHVCKFKMTWHLILFQSNEQCFVHSQHNAKLRSSNKARGKTHCCFHRNNTLMMTV